MNIDDKIKDNCEDNCESKCEAKREIRRRNFEFGKTYYIDKSGIDIDECELKCIKDDCTVMVKSCCRLQIPKGFRIANRNPGMCFNLSNLSCVKNPIVKKIELPSCNHKHSTDCDVVTGYEINVVGEVEFSASVPICPKKGCCFKNHSNVCCNTIVPVNKTVSYTCCPNPCPKCEECVDWKFAYLCIDVKEDCCGQYLQVNVGVALEYTGVCECDEE